MCFSFSFVPVVAVVAIALYMSGITNEQHDLLNKSSGEEEVGRRMSPAFKGIEGNYLQNSENLWIYYREWKPKDQPKALVVIAHGYIDHSGWYSELAERISKEEQENNLHIIAWDHVGFGRSEGNRGYSRNFSLLSDDFITVVKKFNTKPATAERIPTICIGKSMGTDVILLAQENNPTTCDAIVLISTPLSLLPFEKWEISLFIGRLASQFTPKLPIRKAFEPQDIAFDEETVQRQINDPFAYHGRTRARFGITFLEVKKRVVANLDKINVPILVLQGKDDPITPPESAEIAMKFVKSQNKKLITYDHCKHNILQEPNVAEKATSDIISFIHSLL